MTQSNHQVKKAASRKDNGFRPFHGLSSWWKGRKFYFPPQEDLLVDDTSTRTETKSLILEQVSPQGLVSTAPSRVADHGTIASLTDWPMMPLPHTQPRQPQHRQYPYTSQQSFDSLQDSIETMDSVADSYEDLEDDIPATTTAAATAATKTPVLADMEYELDFLMEHLGFLTAHTQPRPVQIVYRY